jgi:hypothetical protein
MTTDQPPRDTRHGAASPRWGGLLVGPLSASVLVLAALVLADGAAALGAAIGGLLVCFVFAFGALVLGVIAKVAPAASLLVALLTYTLQVVLVGLAYVALSGNGALEGPVDPRWLSGAVIACTLTWTVTQVIVSTRVRQPIYDLPSGRPEANVR